MQSGAEEDWDDEDWEDDDSGSSFISDMSMASKMKLAGAGALVLIILIFAMVSQNFGFYYGAGSLTVIIDVNEGKDPGDRTFNAGDVAHILALKVLSPGSLPSLTSIRTVKLPAP
jgi:hypothetical protein